MVLQSVRHRINVLLYTADSASALRLTELLTSEDMAVTTAHSLQDLQEAIKHGALDVATTNTAGVEITRRVTALPVVNFEAFVFTPPGKEDGQIQKRQLDSSAFLKRLLDVACQKTFERRVLPTSR